MSEGLPQPSWGAQIQKLRLATFERGIRLVGFTSPTAGAGVSTVCFALASATAASGVKTLLVDLSQPEQPQEELAEPRWLPGSGRALVSVARSSARFDLLATQPTHLVRERFTNSAELRRTLIDELAEYAAIIVDLAPIWATGRNSIDATAAATACGNVYLVCGAGEVSKTLLLDSVERLHSAGVEILGLIVNDAQNPSLGSELAREARRLRRFMPKLSRALEKRFIANVFLNR